jgi:hypothetical protein
LGHPDAAKLLELLPAPGSEPEAPAEKAEGEQQPATESNAEAFLREVKERNANQWVSVSLEGGG